LPVPNTSEMIANTINQCQMLREPMKTLLGIRRVNFYGVEPDRQAASDRRNMSCCLMPVSGIQFLSD
jgi:hypothetical protein